jgi:uncharacterized protein with NRDE domain
MCILFIGVKVHPDFPLIVCANRDEFHHRPTAPAHHWQNPAIVAGKDNQAGGTWLGVSKKGGIAGITNIRTQGQANGVRSRGELVVKALSDEGINHTWLAEHALNYNPFNLVYQEQEKLKCFNSKLGTSVILDKGFHAISNGNLDDIWPKMAKGQQAIEAYLLSRATPEAQHLLALMLDESQASDALLPATGLSLEWERRLSAIFIRHPEYGTRSTSLVMQDNQGQIHFTEVRYDGKARNLGQQDFTITP